MMALLSPLLSLSPTPPITSISLSSSSFPIRMQSVSVAQHPAYGHSLQRAYAPVIAEKRGDVAVAMASATGQSAGEGGDNSEGKDESTPVQDLPLESKLQLKLEQKERMKLAKKIRLRRNRLNRKRKMRKKGRWPPSKMKKLKNV